MAIQTIELKNVFIEYIVKKQHKRVLSDINYIFNNGKLYGITGENGSGKTSLLRTIAGIKVVSKGSILLNNKDILSYSKQDIAKLISSVFSDITIPGFLSVKEFVAFGRSPYTGCLDRLCSIDKQIIQEAINFFNLNGYEHKEVALLSDGEKQKVILAKAYAQQTPILLLDEPTAHLDIKNKQMIFELLKKMCVEKQKLVILISHDLHFVSNYADITIEISKEKLNQNMH